jgi:hypothetical protein
MRARCDDNVGCLGFRRAVRESEEFPAASMESVAGQHRVRRPRRPPLRYCRPQRFHGASATQRQSRKRGSDTTYALGSEIIVKG